MKIKIDDKVFCTMDEWMQEQLEQCCIIKRKETGLSTNQMLNASLLILPMFVSIILL